MNSTDDLKDKIDSLTNSFSFLASEYDYLKKSHYKQNDDIANLTKNMSIIQQENRQKDVMILQLTDKVNNLEQHTRNRKLEIHGVKQQQNKNCRHVTKKVIEELKINITDQDIDIAHRILAPKNKNSPIIV